MKFAAMLCLGIFCMFAANVTEAREIKMSNNLKPYITFDDEYTRIFEKRDNVVVRTRDLEDGKVIITDDYKLIIDGREITVDDSLKIKLEQYHGLICRAMKDVKKIAMEGAKMGVHGAAIGVKAVAGVFRMILPNYGPDDLEADMERESEKIEAKADKLEAKADVLEDMLMEIEDLHIELRNAVPELNALGWF